MAPSASPNAPTPNAPTRPPASAGSSRSDAVREREPAIAKRQRILDAARAVCAESGYDGARMDDIAARARVSKGTLYNFFESKEHLFLSAVLESHREAQRRIEEHSDARSDPRGRLAGLLESMTLALAGVSEEMTVNMQVWGVLVRDSAARQRLSDELRRLYAQRATEIRETLVSGARSGVFRDDIDFETVIAGLFAIFDGFVYRSTFDPERANASGLRACFDALIRDAVAVDEAGVAADGAAGEGDRG